MTTDASAIDLNGWIPVSERLPERHNHTDSSAPVLGLCEVNDCFGSVQQCIVRFFPSSKPHWRLVHFDGMSLRRGMNIKVEVIAWQPMRPFPRNWDLLRKLLTPPKAP